MNIYSIYEAGKVVKIVPRFDRMGPFGAGPMTGRGFGPCGLGLGWRRGFGFGKGLGRCFGWNWPTNSKGTRQDLAEYKKALKEELADIEKEEKELAAEK
jgi:hypothetical protein